MNQITEYIIQINCLNYNNHCKYIKKKLLSVDSSDISHIIFFKKLHVIFHHLPGYLAELHIKVNERGQHLFDFWDELHDDSYFNDNMGCIQIKYINLSNNMYQISVPVKNTPIPVICYINID